MPPKLKLYNSLLNLSHNEETEISREFLKKKLNEKPERSKYMVFENDYMWQVDVKYLPPSKSLFNFLLVAVDASSRLCDAEPMKELNQEETIDALRKIINRKIISDGENKTPMLIVSDNGGEFGANFSEYLDSRNIKHRTSSAGRKEQTSIVEHINELIAYALSAHAYKLRTTPKNAPVKEIEEINYLADRILPRTIQTINTFMKTKYPLDPKLWFKFNHGNQDAKFEIGDIVFVKNVNQKKFKYRSGQHRYLDIPFYITKIFYPVLDKEPIRYMTSYSEKMTFKGDEMIKEKDFTNNSNQIRF